MTEPAAVVDRPDVPTLMDEARALAASLSAGRRLDPLALEGLPLLDDERPFAEVDVTGWRWMALDGVAYERRALLAGGPLLMCTTGILSALGNGRRRREAERIAAPQWRPLGPVRVVATDRRLLVWHLGAWWSVWFDAVSGVHHDLAAHRLDLAFRDDAPYRLEGPSVPLLAVVLAWLWHYAGNFSEIA